MAVNLISKLKNEWASLSGKTRFLRICMGIVIYIVAVSVLVLADLPASDKFEVGRPAPWTVKANRYVQVTDNAATLKDKEEAAKRVPLVEYVSTQALDISKKNLQQTFDLIAQAKSKHSGKKFSEAEISELAERVPLNLSFSLVQTLLNADPTSLEQYHTNSEHILSLVMQTGVRDNELKEASQRIEQEAKSLPGLTSAKADIDASLAQAALVPNKFPDLQATQKAKARAMDSVEPRMRDIQRGQVILREGELVGEEDLTVIKALGIAKQGITINQIITYCTLLLIMGLVVQFYFKLYLPHVHGNPRLLFGFAFLSIIFIIAARYSGGVSPYLTPITFTSMLVSILLDSRLALMMVSVLGIYAGLMTQSLDSVIVVIITGMVSALAVQNTKKRWNVVTASLLVWAVNVAVVLLLSLSGNGDYQKSIMNALLYGGLNGLVPALLAAGALPFLESACQVTTHIKMLELANPDEPALHELLNKAPGTYQHSIMVANLAEAAAQAIGADFMLCRAGAYYHDLGKIKQPNMFVENQTAHENPHDKLPPSISAMIIISHVTQGQELAKQYKLPPELAKFITEHHGTNLASFFYQKAKAQEDDPVFAEDFTYPGPRPQSKETAIVMICDGIEAAARTLPSPNRESLKNLIEKIVANIINNHQLDECPLSLKDINTIKASVLRSLTSHYHNRIAYPDAKSLRKSKPKK
ncbi:MAG: HDIG domain-containing protein [bacterium]|nr:HDIG domain-containing protein [bacterium]